MYMEPSQISFFVYYLEAPPDQLYRLLYGGPADQFFHLLYGPPPPLVSFCAYYMGAPSDQFLWILHVYGGPLRSVSSLTTGGPLRSASSLTIWGPPQVSFFAYYMGTSLCQFLRLLCGPP